jgi:hypothetical protein
MSTSPPEPKATTERLNEMAFAFKKSGTLLAALDLNVFTVISEGAATVDAVAEATGMDREATERLLVACHALDLVRTDGDSYHNAPDVEKFLVRGQPTYFGDYLVYQARQEYDWWKNITYMLRPQRPYDMVHGTPEAAREFTRAGYNSSISLGHRLAKRFDFSRYSLFADLGGGSGCYSIAACSRHPNLRAVVFDYPDVVTVTREFIEMNGLSDRITTQAGDFIEDDLPEGADLMAFITPLQVYGPERVVSLMEKVHRALPPGGTILIIDYMLADEKSGPLDPALTNLSLRLLPGAEGRVNSGAEFRDYLTRAGFADIDVSWFLPHQLGLVVGHRPQ